MSSTNKNETDRLRFWLNRKQHYVYLIHIESDNVAKIGRTCRLKHRLKNLNQGLYKPFKVYLIHCNSGCESLALEKSLHKALQHKHVKGEWFRGTEPELIQSLLVAPDWGHLLLVEHSDEQIIPEPSMVHKQSFVITLY